jgi:hypothetical protein
MGRTIKYDRIDREKYMEHTVTDLEGKSELVLFSNYLLGN